MKKDSGQVLILILFVITAFCAITVSITDLTLGELELREIDEISLQAQYAAESGTERARYVVKAQSPISAQITINENNYPGECGEVGADCNPLENGYAFEVTVTPYEKSRSDGSACSCTPTPEPNCCCGGLEDYCIDTSGESPY